MKGTISAINPMSMTDGPGYRVVITLSNDGEVVLTPNETVDRIRKFRPYIGLDGGGVTFVGDSFIQSEYLKETCHICHKAGINTCVITDGYNYDKNSELINYIDVVILNINSLPLYNYKDLSIDELMSVNSFANYLNEINKELWVKQVIKKGINDNEDYIRALRKFVLMFNNITDIELIGEDIKEEELNEYRRILSEG